MALRRAFALATVTLVSAPAGAAAQELGSFNQLTGARGCIAQVGTGIGSCERGRALDVANAVAVSPDQRHVYVASGGDAFSGSNAVVAFSRSPDDGSLEFVACVSDNGGDGRVGTDGRCEDGDALMGANDVAVTADGRFVYVTSGGSSGVAWFERDPETGQLSQRGCIKEFVRGDRCDGGLGLLGASGVGVSSDGASVYVTSRASGAVVTFARNPATGALTQIQCISDSGSDGACADATGLADASEVAVAPDGADVYVTSIAGAVTGYRRDPATGRLRPQVCLLDEPPADGPCRGSRALAGASDVAVSPDGRSVFVASRNDNALAIFSRDPETGDLTAHDCFTDDRSAPGPSEGPDEPDEDADDARARSGGTRGCRLALALDFATTVAVSADGQAVFVVSPDDYLAAFRRDPSTGRLEQFACAEDAVTHAGCVDTRTISGGRGVAVSSDGRSLYLANPREDAVAVFAATVAIESRAARLRSDGSIRVRMACPTARHEGCAGQVRTRLASRTRFKRVGARYRLRAGTMAMVRVSLGRETRRRVRARGEADLQVVARERTGDVRRTARHVMVR